VNDIFGYLNYREFLRDFYLSKKANQSGYSYRVFARQAGIGSPSHLKMVIDGKRNLSLRSVPGYVRALGLGKREADYFEMLVKYAQASRMDDRARMLDELFALRPRRSATPLEQERYRFLSHWYFVAIYVLVAVDGFNEDPDWIVQRLRGRITRKQATDALISLEKLGLISRGEHGDFVQSVGTMTIEDDTRAAAVFRYHSETGRLARESLRKDKQDMREMNGATIPIPKSKLSVLKERIRKFRKEMNELASSMDDPDSVYQLNIQFFPLTEDVSDE
jgi:uncharacterized protein (TIGR02147 family)